jgi:predicted GNAT family N-acyltransferase
VYAAHFNKATELANMHAPICFVVEMYEPFQMRLDKKELEYVEMTENDLILNAQDLKKMRSKRIVGTLSIRNHHALNESAWIYRLAVDPNYSYNQIAKPLVIKAMQHAHDNGLYSVESSSAECDEEKRELFLKVGFHIRQIYHKSIIGSSLRVMKAQLGIDLKKYFRTTQNKSALNEN